MLLRQLDLQLLRLLLPLLRLQLLLRRNLLLLRLPLPALALRSRRCLNPPRDRFQASPLLRVPGYSRPNVLPNKAHPPAQSQLPRLQLQHLHARARLRDRRCLPVEIEVQFQAQFQEVAVQVAPVQANLCGLNSRAKAVLLLLAPVVQVGKVKAVPVAKAVRGGSGPVRCRWALVPDHARPAVPKCFLHCPTRCRLRRSRASRSTRASLLSASVLRLTSVKLKESASSTRRVIVRAQVAAAPLRLPLLLRSRASRVKSR